MKRIGLALALIFSASSSMAGVSEIDVNKLLTVCTGKDPGACEGFILGAMGMHAEDHPGHAVVCPARSATISELREVVVKYIRAHPETRSLKGAGVTVLALHQAFPCAK